MPVPFDECECGHTRQRHEDDEELLEDELEEDDLELLDEDEDDELDASMTSVMP